MRELNCSRLKALAFTEYQQHTAVMTMMAMMTTTTSNNIFYSFCRCCCCFNFILWLTRIEWRRKQISISNKNGDELRLFYALNRQNAMNFKWKYETKKDRQKRVSQTTMKKMSMTTTTHEKLRLKSSLMRAFIHHRVQRNVSVFGSVCKHNDGHSSATVRHLFYNTFRLSPTKLVGFSVSFCDAFFWSSALVLSFALARDANVHFRFA